MSQRSVHIDLPYIQPAQAQKHVTHNEALRALDALVQLSVADTDRTAPPAAAQNGDRHIVAVGAAGLWAGQDGAIAVFDTGVWVFYAPQTGWQALVVDQAAHVFWDGTAWAGVGLGADGLGPLDTLGVNAAADVTNRVSVAADATLLSHDGSDHRLKVNKAQDTDTASMLFQSGFSGHAEMGLTGGIDFALRVSADGSTFSDALSVDAATGRLAAPAGINLGQSTLDHYDHGVWTPRLTFGDTDTGITYDANFGSYVRIGQLVMLQCSIDLSSKGTATGPAAIQDLPYDVDPLYYPGEVFFISGGENLNTPKCRAFPGRKIGLMNSGVRGAYNLDEDNFSDATKFKITMMHMI